MKRIIIICEGETEQEFCKTVLYPYFLSKNLLINYPLIKKSGGGIVKWTVLKKQIDLHLQQETAALVTSFIDFYGLNDKLEFPEWEASKAIVDKAERITFLENAMQSTIDESLRYRFMPYVQLHEFEGLLFNDLTVFNQQFAKNEFSDYLELAKTIADFPNPELINDGNETAPSKRLKRIIKGYNKPIYGSILAETIGLKRIRAKSPRFNNWIEKLEAFGN